MKFVILEDLLKAKISVDSHHKAYSRRNPKSGMMEQIKQKGSQKIDSKGLKQDRKPDQIKSKVKLGDAITVESGAAKVTAIGKDGVTARDENDKKYQIVHNEVKQGTEQKPESKKSKLEKPEKKSDEITKESEKTEEVVKGFISEVQKLAGERGENWKTQVREIEDYGDRYVVETLLWEQDAEQVSMTRYKENTKGLMGRYEVTFSKDKSDSHISALFLKDQFQSGGLGTDLIKKLINYGEKNGYRKFSMLANGEVGTYCWPLQGFDWVKGKDSKNMSTDFSEWLKKKHNKDVKPDEFKHSWDIASFKIEDKKVGKDYLLGDGKEFFEAALDLDSGGGKIFEEYQRLRELKKKG